MKRSINMVLTAVLLGTVGKTISRIGLLLALAIIGISMAAPTRADVLVQAFSDIEGAPGCSISVGTAGTCSVTDAASSANLATGVLGVQANCCDYATVSSGQSSSTARFSDTVTLVLPNGYAASTIPFVTFDLTLSGAS